MASGGTLPRGATRTGTVTGVVVVAHGGQSSSTEPTNALQPAVLRMIPVAAAVRHGLRGSSAVVLRPRFRVRGWNGAQASPAADLHELTARQVPGFGCLHPPLRDGRDQGSHGHALAFDDRERDLRLG